MSAENEQKKPELAEKSAKGTPALIGGALLTEHGERPLNTGDVVVACSRPGFSRAGVTHPHCAVYAKGHFTDSQIELLRREKLLSVIRIGG